MLNPDRSFYPSSPVEYYFMQNRRQFLTTSVRYGVSLMSLPMPGGRALAATPENPTGNPNYSVKLDTPTRLYDGKSCWTHPRVGMIPGAGINGMPLAVMTMNILDLEGSDVFRQMSAMYSEDLGKRWTTPEVVMPLCPRIEVIEDIRRPVALSDYWPKYHGGSGKLLGIGHTVAYTQDWKVTNPRPRHTAYSVYDVKAKTWAPWQKFEMPDPVKFYNSGAGCSQRYDREDGTILMPFYFQLPGSNLHAAVALCRFDGTTLRYVEHGSELGLNQARGLYEPSVTRYGDKYFLTLRNDLSGYVTTSNEGLNYGPVRPWQFDDGTDLGNYNTQQHWVTHSDGLFLVYTRRGANNDHVFRHRAPLFMAEVDPERLCIIRSTETILIPQRGARFGNFGVTEVSPGETWVTESEWMQPKGVDKYGSDGSVYVARIQWDRPNKLFR